MVIDQIVKDNYSLINGDCIQVMKDLPDNSIHYSIFSPPFAELYTYSDNIEDLGNSKDYNQFFVGFNFVISELHRIIKEGRLVTVHCIDIPAMKERDGYIGLKDFPGDIIREFQKAGFIYHSRCTIWKNPLIEATRTKALGLMHKQLCKDSAMCRQGLPDYVLTFRKKGENKEPINNGDGLKQFIGENEPTEKGLKYSHEVWRRYASPVWMDINQGRVLKYREGRHEDDERHICPLQLDVIERCVELWSNKNEICLSPFAGIGSEPYSFLKMERKAIGIELKKSYYDTMVKNIENIGNEMNSVKKLF